MNPTRDYITSMKTPLPNRRLPARFVSALALALLPIAAVAAERAGGTGAATAGGGRSTGGVYANQATLGQAAGPTISGGVYRLSSGFQSGNARTADPPPASGAPIISFIPDQVIDEDTDTGLIPVTISDPDTALPQLTINRTSSNPLLVRPVDIVFGGTGSNRMVRITPRPNQSGSAIITITASDPQNHSTSESFLLEVLPVNDPPLLQAVTQAGPIEDTPTGDLPILVRDLETPAAELVVTARSDNPALVPAGAFTFGGGDSNRWVRIQPAPDQFGQALITVRVSDGEAVTEMSFPFTVLPRNDPPTILPLADVTIESGKQRAIELFVNDVDDDLASLTVLPASDNASLIPPGGLALTGQGLRRLLTITPESGQTGAARVGLQVTDPHGATASTSFRVTVTPAPARTPPRIARIVMMTGGRFQLRVAAEAGTALSLESSPSLGADAVWRREGTTATGNGAELELQSDPSSTPARFYRIRAD